MPHDARAAEIADWLRRARDDIRAFDLDLAADPPLLEDAAFHAQQAVEKSLKAFLVWHERPFRKTHDIGEIGQLCADVDSSIEPLVRRADALTVYAWAFRYPSDVVAPLAEEVEEAGALAREVWDAVTARLRDVTE